jgi:hypothetical protein
MAMSIASLVGITLPGYSITLLIWIVPIIGMMIFFIGKRLLTPEKSFALLATVVFLASIGIVLDLLFAHDFFTFNNTHAICGIKIRGIPLEEFVFYITGFWFILFFYVFCDEWFLLKYNVSDLKYARFRSRLKRKLFLHLKSLWLVPVLIVLGTLYKRIANPAGEFFPGYFAFLVMVAYVPAFLFYRITRNLVNWPAFFFSLQLTALISVIWEVTLAIPREYWGYQKGAMLGIFIKPWHDLPIEAVTVWLFSTLVILVYEFIKICYFTPIPSVPCYGLFLKVGREWRNTAKKR